MIRGDPPTRRGGGLGGDRALDPVGDDRVLHSSGGPARRPPTQRGGHDQHGQIPATAPVRRTSRTLSVIGGALLSCLVTQRRRRHPPAARRCQVPGTDRASLCQTDWQRDPVRRTSVLCPPSVVRRHRAWSHLFTAPAPTSSGRPAVPTSWHRCHFPWHGTTRMCPALAGVTEPNVVSAAVAPPPGSPGSWSFKLRTATSADFRSLSADEIGDVLLLVPFRGGVR